MTAAEDDSELEHLRQWKAEALLVLAEWETVWLAAGCPGPLGTSKARAVRRFLDDLLCAESADLHAAMTDMGRALTALRLPAAVADDLSKRWSALLDAIGDTDGPPFDSSRTVGPARDRITEHNRTPVPGIGPPVRFSRCEHGLPLNTECEQCLWAQTVADDQASDEDYDDG